jgi:HD superfamily phosphohydrolase
VITDPVHGDIFVTELERRIIDSPGFQRLRRVLQLGTTQLVYPGATHSRFAHSLGALCVAQDLMDAVVAQELGPHPKTEDLFSEWESEGVYPVRLAEATVLARLGGLLHDFTHIPFGHTIEDDLGLLDSHDRNSDRYKHYWETLDPQLRKILESQQLERFLRPLIISKFQAETKEGERRPYSEVVVSLAGEGARARAEQYEFVADIVGNTICADLLDYLRRDHLNTGLPLAVGERYLSYFYVTPTKRHKKNRARMVLRIHRGGRRRADVITELLKHLRYRYELSERALVHHAKLAADAMLGKAISMWRDALWVEAARRKHPRLGLSRSAALSEVREAVRKRDIHSEADIWAEVRTTVEAELRRRGDFGFLEWLRDWADGIDRATDSRRWAVGQLVSGLLDRRLFKPVAKIDDVPDAEEVYEKYKDTEERRQLEQGAARFAGIQPTWHLLLWIPEPGMRLKMAEVLVDTGQSITTFVNHERGAKEGSGAQIYDAHRDLWGISVFVEADLKREQERNRVDAALSWLAMELEVRVVELGLGDQAEPWDAPDYLAIRRVLTDNDTFSSLRGEESTLLLMLKEQRAASLSKPGATFDLRMDEVRDAAQALVAARGIVQLEEFLRLRGREPEMYRQVLETAPYDARKITSDGLSERFRTVAQGLIDDLEGGAEEDD